MGWGEGDVGGWMGDVGGGMGGGGIVPVFCQRT